VEAPHKPLSLTVLEAAERHGDLPEVLLLSADRQMSLVRVRSPVVRLSAIIG